MAQNPLVGLAHADSLAQIQWHEDVHRVLAESVLATLAENPGAAPADVVTRAAQATPHAARVLTGGGAAAPGATPAATAAYLAEELALGVAADAIGALTGRRPAGGSAEELARGDAEDAIGALKAQLTAGVSAEEAELLHAAVTTLQMDVAARREAHRALPQA